MSCFNPEAYEKLYKKIQAAGDPDDMKLIRDETARCLLYVQTVCDGENELNTTQNPDRQQIGDYDARRHTAHEDAIVAAKVLSRFAENNGFGLVYTGDPLDRHQVAAFCLELAGWLFENRRRVL